MLFRVVDEARVFLFERLVMRSICPPPGVRLMVLIIMFDNGCEIAVLLSARAGVSSSPKAYL